MQGGQHVALAAVVQMARHGGALPAAGLRLRLAQQRQRPRLAQVRSICMVRSGQLSFGLASS